MTMVAFTLADDIVCRFLNLLENHKIQSAVDSELKNDLLAVTELIKAHRKIKTIHSIPPVDTLRKGASLYDFAAKVLSAENLPEFSDFINHLKLIAQSKNQLESFFLLEKSRINDTARKMVELYVGCLAAHIGFDVKLDDPNQSKGDNPDVIFTFRPQPSFAPQRWTLAIKATYSESGQTIFERINEAAKQINKCNEAEYGLIVINITGALDHNSLWNPSTPFCDLDAATTAFNQQINAYSKNRGRTLPR